MKIKFIYVETLKKSGIEDLKINAKNQKNQEE